MGLISPELIQVGMVVQYTPSCQYSYFVEQARGVITKVIPPSDIHEHMLWIYEVLFLNENSPVMVSYEGFMSGKMSIIEPT